MAWSPERCERAPFSTSTDHRAREDVIVVLHSLTDHRRELIRVSRRLVHGQRASLTTKRSTIGCCGCEPATARGGAASSSELKRLELERRWRNRQLDGSEVDIDALVDRQATLMAGRHPDPRIYVRRKVHDSELAMLILIDASLSSDSWVAGKRIFDVVRDSTQVLVEAFEPTSAKLAISAFYSNTRRDCRFLVAKGFEDSSRLAATLAFWRPRRRLFSTGARERGPV